MLRIGSKYQVELLRNESVERLKTWYPSTLSNFDLSYEDVSLPGKAISTSIRPRFRLFNSEMVSDTFEVITLARKLHLDFLLPAAFYECASSLTVEDLVHAIRDKHLTYDDVIIAIRGQSWLREQNTKLLMPIILRQTNSACKTPLACARGFGDLLCENGRWLERKNALEHCKHWFTDSETRKFGICITCVASFRDSHELGRQALWNEMGEKFGASVWPLDD